MSQKNMACHKKKINMINMKEKIATKEDTDPLFPPRGTLYVRNEYGLLNYHSEINKLKINFMNMAFL